MRIGEKPQERNTGFFDFFCQRAGSVLCEKDWRQIAQVFPEGSIARMFAMRCQSEPVWIRHASKSAQVLEIPIRTCSVVDKKKIIQREKPTNQRFCGGADKIFRIVIILFFNALDTPHRTP